MAPAIAEVLVDDELLIRSFLKLLQLIKLLNQT